MSSQSFIDELSRGNLKNEHIDLILSHVELLQVKNQTRLIRPGEICDKAYFVLEGAFVCRYIDEKLEIEKTINFYLDELHPFMSCVDSFFSGTKTSCELRAVSPASVLVFHKKDIEKYILEDIHLFQFYHSLVTTALQEENDFKLKIISLTSDQLYQYILDHYPMIIHRIPSRFIAEFMGISQEWLSKLKRKKPFS